MPRLRRNLYVILQLIGILLFFKIRGLLGILVMVACIIIGAVGYRSESKKIKNYRKVTHEE
jgi:hypothetical protein